MGMTFHTSSPKMAVTIIINMTQRTRNHSVEFLLSVTATTVTRKHQDYFWAISEKSQGTGRGPSPQPRISWRGAEEATEEIPSANVTASAGWKISMSPVQEAPSALEDLKTLITASDWALGGLVVIGIFCLVFIALILFAAIFGCCTSSRHKQSRTQTVT